MCSFDGFRQRSHEAFTFKIGLVVGIVGIFLVLKPVHELMSVKSGGIVSFERVDDVKFSILSRCGIMLLIEVVKVAVNHITRGRVCDKKDLLSVWGVLKVSTDFCLR